MDLLDTLLLAGTGLLAFFLTGLQIRLNRVLRLTAAPQKDRWHQEPTPSAGGIAVFFATGLVYAAVFRGQHAEIALAAGAMWALGLVDDLVRLPPSLKFAGQAVIASFAVASGVVFHATSTTAFNLVLSFLWLVGITNAFNLIDNMDGLCAGVVVIISLSLSSRLTAHGDRADAALCVMVGSAYAGFLAWNYRPARIFMGDCGSLFAGFTMAALTIASPSPQGRFFPAGLSYPALTFTYPIFDMVLVLVLRSLAGRPISAGGRDHSSHRLVFNGLGEARAVGLLWILTALGCGIGLLFDAAPLRGAAAGALLWTGLAVLGWFLARGERGPQSVASPDRLTLP